MDLLKPAILISVFMPLVGALLGQVYPKKWGRALAHRICIFAVLLSFIAACFVFTQALTEPQFLVQFDLYQWGRSGGIAFPIGFYVDPLGAVMMWMVSFISLMVHIYSIAYMKEDPGYVRFFCLIAFFTFSMLILVSSHNFLQLFFGWEGVGLASYLLIGFWFHRPSATRAGLKAFLINRIGDLGFLMGIACILFLFDSLEYTQIFKQVAHLSAVQQQWISFLALSLFVGAMGKSAQIPLHIWLPDSMEGPTPISALIHAATMVTAGVFMIVRFAPIFEHSTLALNTLLGVGALTCFLMGIMAILQNDLKRIIAYSTLSQLGLMMVAVGASGYGVAIFHLITHAFFKALLFLSAGAVILALDHEQDVRKMGGLRKQLPIPYWTMLIGVFALVGFPGFSGFYSKDLIIEVAKQSNLFFGGVAYYTILGSVFITAWYSFRLLFLVFHGHSKQSIKLVPQTTFAMNGPLILLAVFSIFVGICLLHPILQNHLNLVQPILLNIHSDPLKLMWHGFFGWPFGLLCLGALSAWYTCFRVPNLFTMRANSMYGFNFLYENVLTHLARIFAKYAREFGEKRFIEGIFVNGIAYKIKATAKVMRKAQTGYLDQYAFFMVVSLVGILVWIIYR